MAIYTISDVHVKNDGENLNLLMSFLNRDFKSDDSVYLLGDIFDLMVGPHQEYINLYKTFFNKVSEIQSKKVEFIYFEGNHDFHLEKLFSKNGIKIIKKPFIKEFNDKKILFCHGDDIELGNPGYVIWKKFVNSYIMTFVANHILSFKLLDRIGSYLSQKSRKRNKNRYGNPQDNLRIRDDFRYNAKVAAKKYGVDTVVCGHSHYMDNFEDESYQYVNNGYVPYTKSYLKLTQNKIEINSL